METESGRSESSFRPGLADVQGISKRFAALPASDDVSFTVGQRRRDPCADRAERRRQDHDLQHDRRHVQARHRRDPARRPVAGRHAAGPDLPGRRRPHLPDRAAVPRVDAARKTSPSARWRGPTISARRATTRSACWNCSVSPTSASRAPDSITLAGPQMPRSRARACHQAQDSAARRGDGRVCARPRPTAWSRSSASSMRRPASPSC